MPQPYPDVRTEIPRNALPSFGLGAFRGTVVPDSSADLDPRAVVTDPDMRPASRHYRPVAVTDFSAPNRLRLGVPDVLHEFYRYLTRFTGEIFVSQVRSSATVVVQAPPRVLGKVLANRRSFYEPPEYGTPANSDYASSARRRRLGR